MNYFSAFSLVLTKLFLLGCFSLMGVGEVLANEPVPCHEVAAEEISDCPVCPMAFDAWDTETTLETPDITFEFFQSVAVDVFVFEVLDILSAVQVSIRPPPDIIPDASLLAFNTVRLIL